MTIRSRLDRLNRWRFLRRELTIGGLMWTLGYAYTGVDGYDEIAYRNERGAEADFSKCLLKIGRC